MKGVLVLQATVQYLNGINMIQGVRVGADLRGFIQPMFT